MPVRLKSPWIEISGARGQPGQTADALRVAGGRIYVCAGTEHQVRVYDLATRQRTGTFETGSGGHVIDLEVTGPGDVYVTDGILPLLWHLTPDHIAAGGLRHGTGHPGQPGPDRSHEVPRLPSHIGGVSAGTRSPPARSSAGRTPVCGTRPTEPSWVRERLGFRPPRPVGRWWAGTPRIPRSRRARAGQVPRPKRRRAGVRPNGLASDNLFHSHRAGEGLANSRRHYLNVPRPIRRGVHHGCNPGATTRTGRTPASDDELTIQDQPPTRSTSCLLGAPEGLNEPKQRPRRLWPETATFVRQGQRCRRG